jgi:hypothetical protein
LPLLLGNEVDRYDDENQHSDCQFKHMGHSTQDHSLDSMEFSLPGRSILHFISRHEVIVAPALRERKPQGEEGKDADA